MAKRRRQGSCFCFVSPVTPYSPVTKAVSATWTPRPHFPFLLLPPSFPLLPEAVH